MITQTLTSPSMTCNFVVAPAEELVQADSRDYGFDFDEEELASELLAPLPAGLADQPIPEVGAGAFEKVFQYFLS
ncbi:MAG: hypothetical protein HUU11_03205 [Anaerolineales bacterium]|nr:hypothetical protein [Anaerolineales bacterium]NUQ83699.1 hypothetical protein [Anaerolineales bacterium]